VAHTRPLDRRGSIGFMMKCWGAAVALALVVFQTPDQPAARILGTWHGTSTCVDRQVDRACGDEEVIYVIDSAAGPRGPVRMAADKLVNGVRQPMGELRLEYDAPSRTWSVDLDARFRARWSFRPQGEDLLGTLTELPGGRLVRRVTAHRVPARQSGPPNQHAQLTGA
jgi:hypothetical protein